MNNFTKKIIAFTLCGALTLGCVITGLALTEKQKSKPEEVIASAKHTDNATAVSKDETVYVLANADGSVKKIIVSDWIKNSLQSDTVNDVTELTDIENVKGNESYTMNGNAAVWDTEGNDIYYRGNIEKELPVGLTVTYKLDGKTVSAEEIAGKSGKAVIRFDYDNRQYETVEIDGKPTKINVPFVMLTGTLLSSDQFRNITVTNGKMINDGDRTAVIGFALPGLQENLGISKEKINIPSYVEISADVTDFGLGTTVTIATNGIFNQFDTSKLDTLDGIQDSVQQLSDGMKQLLDGSSALYGGLCTLLDKSQVLVGGINQLADGAKALKDGAVALDNGAAELKAGANELSTGLNTLKGNNAALNGGAKQVFESLLSTAETQIKAGGIDLPHLTIENFGDVLNGVIESLDETAVYQQALAQVTAAVESNRPMIVTKVTAAVREQVEAQVIQSATGISKKDYEAAVSAGQIPSQTQNAINAAIDEQMQTDEIKSAIEQNVELQVKQAISDNLASTEVQAKLTAASEGAKSIIAAKASLDSYNTFYLGLLTYTDGVASAADGAATLATGAGDLKDGTAQLKTGAAEIYKGILQLKNGTPALVDGVSTLKNGAMQLSDGLKQFNGQGVQKIIDLVSGDFKNVVTRFKATVDVSKNYRNFAGIDDNMTGQVKFIYRTDEIN
ncbi:MAG: hypothetical protein MJ132_03955 [Clostridia bacterium]|nr:hypothetical protein [Clostridia bacterium]